MPYYALYNNRIQKDMHNFPLFIFAALRQFEKPALHDHPP